MKFSCDVFPIVIHLIIEDGDGGTDDGMTSREDHPTIKLFKKTQCDWREVLVHELLHAVGHSMRRIGIEMSEETEECYCYTMQYFYRNMMKRIKKDKLL